MFKECRNHRVSDAAIADGDTVTLLVAGGVTALTLGVAFGLLALGVRSFWVAFPVGFGVILPGVIAMTRARRTAKHQNAATPTEESPTGLEVLRRRYAVGEISDEEFEDRVERLLESEVDEPNHRLGTDFAGR